jgi:hypothetical protein
MCGVLHEPALEERDRNMFLKCSIAAHHAHLAVVRTPLPRLDDFRISVQNSGADFSTDRPGPRRFVIFET